MTKLAALAAGAALLVALASPAEARRTSQQTIHYDGDGRVRIATDSAPHAKKANRSARLSARRAGRSAVARRAHHNRVALPRVHPRYGARYRVTTSGLPGPLVAALKSVEQQCAGFKVISTFRPGARVRGSGRLSLHASGRAADFKVRNYACAYAALKGYKGGMSTDAWRVRHIHLSWGGREHGHHFAHWSPSRYARRYRHHVARAI